uniref:Spt6 acidic N-terminal domain-containing protein n=1 Tax=Bionectria ochroleuca TaxID=29856 RepID=A0A8H7KBJ0_BIOOC
MSNTMRDLISGEAELDDEEDDESFDGETGEQSRKKRATQFDDSSEEEEDDDDEEEAAKIREGFIDDDEEEIEEEESDGERPVVKRKREHRDRDEEARLDEEDLELIGEQFPRAKAQPQSKFKRLKRGHRGEERGRMTAPPWKRFSRTKMKTLRSPVTDDQTILAMISTTSSKKTSLRMRLCDNKTEKMLKSLAQGSVASVLS